MIIKDSVFFIDSKSYLIADLLFFREKRLYIFSKTFIVTDPSWIKTFEMFFSIWSFFLDINFFQVWQFHDGFP